MPIKNIILLLAEMFFLSSKIPIKKIARQPAKKEKYDLKFGS